KEDNWWGPAGETGPCGPDTEIFIDLGKSVNFEKCPYGDDCKPGCVCGRYVEIWNNVFMEYEKRIKNNEKYEYVALAQKNVDTGMGLERTLAVLNGFDNVYETDTLKSIIEKIEKLAPVSYKLQTTSYRVIADHIRTSVFMISDGVAPSNLDRGYVLRRLLRRAIRHGNLLKIPNGFLLPLAEAVIDIYKDFYPELELNRDKILEEIKKEEGKFEIVLISGKKILEKKFDKYMKQQGKEGVQAHDAHGYIHAVDPLITGKEAFQLYSTNGIPIEKIKEFADEKNFLLDEKGFNKELQKHQQLSRTASAGKFKGGLADAGEETVRLHTVAHLLLESLRRVLGDHIFQKGSNINAERLRFDFSHSEKLTDEEKQKVEGLVNEQIQKNLPVNCEEISLEEAKKIGAMGVFEDKYGERVKVYTIGEGDDIFSVEICGGPHIENTSKLGKFKIKKEQSSSAGVRRIKAVLE
ncbi:MAG: alanine--tRNA ligase, partial [Patescibacteria group bacterium]|nr:alanine--tRNA ligase [Patescibacteria group bacterium]